MSERVSDMQNGSADAGEDGSRREKVVGSLLGLNQFLAFPHLGMRFGF